MVRGGLKIETRMTFLRRRAKSDLIEVKIGISNALTWYADIWVDKASFPGYRYDRRTDMRLDNQVSSGRTTSHEQFIQSPTERGNAEDK